MMGGWVSVYECRIFEEVEWLPTSSNTRRHCHFLNVPVRHTIALREPICRTLEATASGRASGADLGK
jgi:hypothetical protein